MPLHALVASLPAVTNIDEEGIQIVACTCALMLRMDAALERESRAVDVIISCKSDPILKSVESLRLFLELESDGCFEDGIATAFKAVENRGIQV